jgi:polygalacturonase
MDETNNGTKHDDVLSRRRLMGALSVPLAAAVVPAVLAACASTASAQPATLPSSNDDRQTGVHVYNIREYGAKGDGVTLDTKALQSAIDACTADHGGTVLVPAGTFVIGTVELKSNVTLHIAAGGKLLGSADGKQYYAAESIPLSGDSTLGDGHVGLLFAVYALNVTVEGPGVIDGQGAQFRRGPNREPPPSGRGGAARPYSLLFHRCKNIVIRNITLTDSAFHAIRINQSTYVQADGIHVHSRVNHNNDGFHFVSAQHVNISNCNIECQDDACALFGSCQFITVTNCSFSTRWSVFRFGGGEAENITVSNCIIYHCYGCPIKMRCGPGSRFENMTFSNLIMQDVTGPISIGLGPPGRRPGTNPATTQYNIEEPTTETSARRSPGIVRNISFNNILAQVTASPAQLPETEFTSGYNVGEIRSCIVLNGVAPAFLQNISFDDVHITFGGGGTAEDAAIRDVPKRAGEYFELGRIPAYGLWARNVRGLTMNNVRFEVEQPDLRPAVIFDHVEDAAVNLLSAQGNPDAESTLRMIDSRQVLLASPRVLTPAAAFIQLEGENNDDIVVDGGSIGKATRAVNATRGANETAVKLRV